MIALSLAIVIVGLAGIGAAWHIAIRLLDRRLVIAGEAKLREEMAALSRMCGDTNATIDVLVEAQASAAERLEARITTAESLAKKAEERVRNRDVAEKMSGRS